MKVKLIFNFVGLMFLLVALFMHFTELGENVVDSYKVCHKCMDEKGVDYSCHCNDTVEYSNNMYPVLLSLFWIGIGFIFLALMLSVLGIIKNKDENENYSIKDKFLFYILFHLFLVIIGIYLSYIERSSIRVYSSIGLTLVFFGITGLFLKGVSK